MNKVIFKTKNFGLTYNNSSINNKIYNKPCNCPYCNYVIDSRITELKLTNSSEGIILLTSNTCTACDKIFIVVYCYSEDKKMYDFVSINPSFKEKEFDDSINDISPRFVDLFNQSYRAEFNGDLELAGSGYRNALEVLIKDFAIKCLKEKEDEVNKIKLHDAIDKYLDNIEMTNAADVVRILGNDNTHYERKYDGIDFKVLKDYLEIFILQIEVKIKTLNPPVERKGKGD